MAEIGADVEALEEFAARLDRNADMLESIFAGITRQVEQTWWKGSDAEIFKDDWDSTYRSQVKSIAEDFRFASQELKRNAQDQRDASGT